MLPVYIEERVKMSGRGRARVCVRCNRIMYRLDGVLRCPKCGIEVKEDGELEKNK